MHHLEISGDMGADGVGKPGTCKHPKQKARYFDVSITVDAQIFDFSFQRSQSLSCNLALGRLFQLASNHGLDFSNAIVSIITLFLAL